MLASCPGMGPLYLERKKEERERRRERGKEGGREEGRKKGRKEGGKKKTFFFLEKGDLRV
jgi:hypothetical protein